MYPLACPIVSFNMAAMLSSGQCEFWNSAGFVKSCSWYLWAFWISVFPFFVYPSHLLQWYSQGHFIYVVFFYAQNLSQVYLCQYCSFVSCLLPSMSSCAADICCKISLMIWWASLKIYCPLGLMYELCKALPIQIFGLLHVSFVWVFSSISGNGWMISMSVRMRSDKHWQSAVVLPII